MLLQEDDSGKLRLVHCFSKKTNETEMVTDCQALVYMNGLKTSNSQITRWFDLMQEFDVEVRHRAGTAMAHVDALSRAPTENSTDTMDEIIANHLEVFTTLTEEQYVKSMQYSDSEIMGIINY
ncbi:unnamed protein product [Macrosiphum euphorbiae]|uniref:Uncharacterized protein n=1 Tax=Macrosiphum euphorbiae TaxID=13131 RepID=A0AAV0VRH4_9HEMI|nr:unnamed protein product [Macrosiphum euphorbiae]